jgi:hypothetical protein
MKTNEITLILEDEDPFMDSYAQELFACHAIIDRLKILQENVASLTINKELLIRILYSHIHAIRKLP